MAAKKTRTPKKPAAPAEGAAKPKRSRKKSVEAGSRGLDAADLGAGEAPPAVRELAAAIAADGGAALATYREPIGGHWAVLAALPIDRVAPTPFQRDLSEPHVARLADVIERLDRFLDPIIAVRTPEGVYWTPNGHHRTASRAREGRAGHRRAGPAGPGGRLQDPRAQHGEGPQPAREGARGGAHGAVARRTSSRGAEKRLRARVRGAAAAHARDSATSGGRASPGAPTRRCSSGSTRSSTTRCRARSRCAGIARPSSSSWTTR